MRIAQDEAERALLWKGRKTAFGAIARIKPNYYLHDTVVPRRRLPEVLRQVYEIADRHDLLVMNVFHAGDGNLHPLLVFDKREPGVMDRVHAAGEEIVRVSVAAGGVLSGEHGIGLEKRDFMPLMFSPVDLAAQAGVAAAFDTTGLANPEQGAAQPGGVCRSATRAGGCVDLTAFAEEVGTTGPVTITGLAHAQADRSSAFGRCSAGRHRVDPGRRDDGALWRRHAGRRPRRSAGRGRPMRRTTRRTGTVGGALAVGRSDIRRFGYGPVRDVLLQARYVSARGEVVKAGGPTVKNVSGFDLCRLLVGSRGTLGFIGDVILRTRPRRRTAMVHDDRRPVGVRRALYRPASVLWNGSATWALLEGHPHDVAAQAATASLMASDPRAAADGWPMVDAAGRSGSLTGIGGSSPRSGSGSCTTAARTSRTASTTRLSSCTSGSRSSSTRPDA